MARVEFREGIQCTKCNKIIIPDLFTSELCQGCGTKLMDINYSNRTYSRCECCKDVTVKITHKLFSDIYEVVEV